VQNLGQAVRQMPYAGPLFPEEPTMHAPILSADPAPVLTDSDRASLTERGHRLLALLTCREALPASSTTVAAVLDRRIDDLLADVGAD